MPRKSRRRFIGRIEKDLCKKREDDLRELREAIHREQYELRRAEEEDYIDALDELDHEAHPGPDDNPHAR